MSEAGTSSYPESAHDALPQLQDFELLLQFYIAKCNMLYTQPVSLQFLFLVHQDGSTFGSHAGHSTICRRTCMAVGFWGPQLGRRWASQACPTAAVLCSSWTLVSPLLRLCSQFVSALLIAPLLISSCSAVSVALVAYVSLSGLPDCGTIVLLLESGQCSSACTLLSFPVYCYLPAVFVALCPFRFCYFKCGRPRPA